MSRRLLLLLAVNAALLGVWVWARTERQTLTVVASTSIVAAYDQSGKHLASAPALHTSGRVGLYLSRRMLPGRVTSVGWALDSLTWLGRESAWESITVHRNSDRQVLLTEYLTPGPRFLLPGEPVNEIVERGDADWSDYTVEATLLRGREQAGISVLGTPDSGRVFLFRPEYRDGGWHTWVEAGFSAPIETVPWLAYRKSLEQQGQDALRLVLGSYPAALCLTLLLGLVGAVGSRVRRRSSQPTMCELAQGPSEAGEIERVESPLGDGVRRGRRPRLSAPTVVALAFSAVGMALGAFVSTYHLERLPHVQDSVAYLFQAKVFALGRLWAPVPALPEFFGHEFVVMYGEKWFAKYPPGHPILLALGVLAGAPWLVSPIAAGLSVFLVYLIGRRAYGSRIGLIAAGLALTSPFFIFMSGSFMAHATGLLFVLLFVWLFLRADRPLTAALCGAALGFGFLIRPWTAGVVAAPFAVLALIDFARAPRKRFVRYAAMSASFVPFVLAWLAYNAALTGDPLRNTMELWWPFDRVGFGYDKGPWGFWPADGLYNLSRNMTELQGHLFGWPPYLTLVFVMLPFVLLRARRMDWLFLAAFASLVAGYSVWWADGIMFGPRFYYESLGFLLLLTARGLAELAGLVGRAAARWGASEAWSRRTGRAFAGGLLALLILHNLVAYLPGQWQLYRGYNFVNRGPVRTVEEAGVTNALVFAHVGEWFEWWNYGMVFSSNQPLLDGNVVYARDLGDVENRRLMDQYPGRTYYRLRGTALTRIEP